MASSHARSKQVSRPSSTSMWKNPPGNRRKDAPDGDRESHPRAEFRGKKQPYTRLSYEPVHGSHDELFVHPKASMLNQMPYKKRKKLPLDEHRNGVVTPADAGSVRLRNLPLLFSKQLKEIGRFSGPPILKKVYQILFPTGHVYKVQDPELRPKAGCIQTYTWDDLQVKTWGLFANAYGITYSGRTEYTFPRGLLGKLVHNGVYARHDVPWPTAKDPGPLEAFRKVRCEPNRRSELSRMLRALKRVKRFVSKPIPLDSVLGVRKVLSRKEIDRRFDHSKPISDFRRDIPNCLSLRFGKPAQVSQIVLDSLRSIYSRPKKFLEDLSWLIPKDKPVEVVLQMKVAPSREQSKRPRAIVTLHSDQGGVFRRSVSTGSQLYLVDTNFSGHIKGPEQRQTVIDNYNSWQKKLDENPDEYQNAGVLGGWFD